MHKYKILGGTYSMAKETKAFKSTNAMIDFEGMKLVESTKDGQNVYCLEKILQEWNEVEGIAFNITLNKDILPDETEY